MGPYLIEACAEERFSVLFGVLFKCFLVCHMTMPGLLFLVFVIVLICLSHQISICSLCATGGGFISISSIPVIS